MHPCSGVPGRLRFRKAKMPDAQLSRAPAVSYCDFQLDILTKLVEHIVHIIGRGAERRQWRMKRGGSVVSNKSCERQRRRTPIANLTEQAKRSETWFESRCAFGIVVSLSYATSIGALLAWSASYCLFRLTHSRRFCLRQITHWVITSFVPWFESRCAYGIVRDFSTALSSGRNDMLGAGRFGSHGRTLLRLQRPFTGYPSVHADGSFNR